MGLSQTLAWFPSADEAERFLHDVGVTLDSMGWPRVGPRLADIHEARHGLLDLSALWNESPRLGPTCGASLRARQHIVSGFLIGGHALHQADRLLTRA